MKRVQIRAWHIPSIAIRFICVILRWCCACFFYRIFYGLWSKFIDWFFGLVVSFRYHFWYVINYKFSKLCSSSLFCSSFRPLLAWLSWCGYLCPFFMAHWLFVRAFPIWWMRDISQLTRIYVHWSNFGICGM